MEWMIKLIKLFKLIYSAYMYTNIADSVLI